MSNYFEIFKKEDLYNFLYSNIEEFLNTVNTRNIGDVVINDGLNGLFNLLSKEEVSPNDKNILNQFFEDNGFEDWLENK